MQRAIVSFLFCAGTYLHAQSFTTSVQPLSGEDLAKDCHYEMTLPKADKTVHGVWVIYDRGPQITSFYSDHDVSKLAERHSLGLLLAHQCNSKNAPGGPEEMDMNPSHGIGRALFTALNQFAGESHHPELSSTKLVLLGFSGTGSFFAHFVEYAPDRVLAAVLIHAAHYEPMSLDTVHLTEEGRQVPELIIAGGADKVATTQAPYDYFRRYREQAAPWTFLVQNGTSHIEVGTVKPLVLGWLDAVLNQRKPDAYRPPLRINEDGSWSAYLAKCPADNHPSPVWNVCVAAIAKAASPHPSNMLSAGWIPSRHVAKLWLQAAQQTQPTL